VRPEAELFQGELLNLLAKLRKEGVQKVWVDGGITISKFLEAKLVDEITLTIIPIILGSGIPLFSPIAQETPCQLTSSRSYPSGLVQLHYAFLRD
jgi:riboflavin biosynthesis pyrimidine reductase